jgi:chorismate mutase
MGFLLHETEQVHAKMRRYTSPDEHPFFKDLPAPVLPTLRYDENPLHPNEVNLNDLIRTVYETEIIPSLCAAGDDQQYGSSAVCDVACLQAMSKRIHYGKFVAESKYELAPERFRDLLQSRNVEAIHDAITDAAVEAQVLQRVDRKVRTYCGEIAAAGTDPQVAPGQVVDTYRRWIIPLTKQVEVEYLLNRQS